MKIAVYNRKYTTTLCLATVLSLLVQTEALANVSYSYDNLGRLASAVYDSGVTIHYLYDLNGNRLTQVVQSNSTVGAWGSFNWGAAKW